jgi:chromosomal replication initiation ATPase DnaA
MTIPSTHSAAFAIPGLRVASINDNFVVTSSEDIIMASVCKYFDLSESDLLKKSRKQPIPMARQIGCYLMIRHCKSTTTHLGKKFGLDHSTISTSNQLIKDQISLPYDNEYKTAVSEIIKLI